MIQVFEAVDRQLRDAFEEIEHMTFSDPSRAMMSAIWAAVLARAFWKEMSEKVKGACESTCARPEEAQRALDALEEQLEGELDKAMARAVEVMAADRPVEVLHTFYRYLEGVLQTWEAKVEIGGPTPVTVPLRKLVKAVVICAGDRLEGESLACAIRNLVLMR